MCDPVITRPLNTNSPESVHEDSCLALDIIFKFYLIFFKLLCGMLFKIALAIWCSPPSLLDGGEDQSVTGASVWVVSCFGSLRVKVPVSKSPCFTIVKNICKTLEKSLAFPCESKLDIYNIFFIAPSKSFSTTWI